MSRVKGTAKAVLPLGVPEDGAQRGAAGGVEGFGVMTWRELALLLGERMKHHAHGCLCDPIDLDNCPFCRDRAAYLAYSAKMASRRRSGQAAEHLERGDVK